MTVRRLFLNLTLIFLLTPSYYGQSVETGSSNESVALQRSWLFADLQALDVESAKIDKPLSRALAKAEIADAAWTLDQVWAKKLLREAYELTLPEEEEQIKLRDKSAGAAPTPPTESDRARSDARNRVLSIASRDKVFADELAQLGARQLGRYEEHFRYARLAAQAIKAGETDTASNYILQSIEADPTQITAGLSILDLAARDREAADNLIAQYIERLRSFPLSMTNQSAFRVYYALQQMMFPGPAAVRERGRLLPAGQTASRAYVGYIIESMGKLEQNEPGSAQVLRPILLSTWLPLNRYAPELAGAFLELEKLSRRPGERASLPQAGDEDAGRVKYEDRIKQALDSGKPDDFVFMSALGRGDFAVARKMIDLLPDGELKTKYTETVNTQEAVSLAAKGDTVGAERLLRQLNKVTSILQAYPAVIGKYVASKDASFATALVYQAVKQLKRAEDPAEIPLSLSSLAKSVAPINDTLALEILDEAVVAANSASMDTEQGRAKLDLNVFRTLAPKNEARARQAASDLKDRSLRISALAAIYQWKTRELTKSVKVN